MKPEGLPKAYKKNEGWNFLVLTDDEAGVDKAGFGNKLITSPFQCLDSALEGSCNFLVIFFSQRHFRDTDEFLQLCAVLKHNKKTARIPVLALLRTFHAGIIRSLGAAGIDYVRVFEESRLSPKVLDGIVVGLGPEDSAQERIKNHCPFINYSRIDDEIDLAVCGAYYNFLALNNRRLRNLCFSASHEECGYFRYPRIEK